MRYGAPPGDFTVVLNDTTWKRLPPTVSAFTVALLAAAAALRNPQGVIQISSCWAQAVFWGVMFCWPGACVATPPVTATAYVIHVARDASCVKSIVRT